MTGPDTDKAHLITLAADIVSAYVSNNHIQSAELPKLLSDVHGAICGVSAGTASEAAAPKATPQEIKRSISADALISFEDGKPYKTLRRHLTLRGLTPEAYRAKWGLPPDYPMTSQSYSEQRSALARSLGLGQQRRREAAAPEPDPAEPAPAEPAETAETAPGEAEKKPRAARRKKND